MIRRGNFVFLTWVGDYGPAHVHVFRDGRNVVKYDLENGQVVDGRLTRRVHRFIEKLREESLL